MNLLHLTPKRNYKSIIKYGLLPSKVKLPQHLDTFNEDGLIGDGVVYLWDPNKTPNTDKIIKDFIYCRHFLHPRNLLCEFSDLHNLPWPNFKELGTKLFGEEEDYILLEVNLNDKQLLKNEYIHEQFSDGCETTSSFLMNSKYEHDNKVLRISNDVIPSRKIKIVNEVSTRFYKNGVIGITYKK